MDGLDWIALFCIGVIILTIFLSIPPKLENGMYDMTPDRLTQSLWNAILIVLPAGSIVSAILIHKSRR